MLQPILETFDLEGIASHIKKGDSPQNICLASFFEQPEEVAISYREGAEDCVHVWSRNICQRR